MVRTRADNTAKKAVAAKAPRKSLGSAASGSCSSAGFASPSGKNKYAGGNAVCDRPTPDWQKDISSFFIKPKNTEKENAEPEQTEKENEKPENEPVENADTEESESSPPKKSKKEKRKPVISSDEEDD